MSIDMFQLYQTTKQAQGEQEKKKVEAKAKEMKKKACEKERKWKEFSSGLNRPD